MSDTVTCSTCGRPMRQCVQLTLAPTARTGSYAGPPPFSVSQHADSSIHAVRTDGKPAGVPPFICRACIEAQAGVTTTATAQQTVS